MNVYIGVFVTVTTFFFFNPTRRKIDVRFTKNMPTLINRGRTFTDTSKRSPITFGYIVPISTNLPIHFYFLYNMDLNIDFVLCFSSSILT